LTFAAALVGAILTVVEVEVGDGEDFVEMKLWSEFGDCGR